ncbi:MAG: hypothetical protein LBV47_03300 [Bacteroidales bacterium]|jgi:hypothetical protein|nr:hypothetical protein [Bacteroidales bacterium]
MKKILLPITLCIFIVGCEKQNEKVPETPEPGLPFTEYSFNAAPGEKPSVRWVNLDYFSEQNHNKSKLLVINSDEELQKYVEGDYPAIDFTKKTLLLAYENYGAGHVLHSYKQYFRQISEQEYVMTVNIPTFLGSVISEWLVAIEVDKLGYESKVGLNIMKK